MAITYEVIETTTLGSATPSVTFSSIPSTYTDLAVVFNGGLNVSDFIYTQVGNGSIDTGANYSGTIVLGYGSGVASSRHSSGTYLQTLGWAIGILNDANGLLHFMNYSNTTTYKTILNRTNSTASGTSAYVGLWRSTSAINTIKFTGVNSRDITAGSTFTLYGIKAA
jgi:hypothetical protein